VYHVISFFSLIKLHIKIGTKRNNNVSLPFPGKLRRKNVIVTQVDDDADEDEDAWADDDGGEDVLGNEAEEAGRTARDIEARMRKDRDRGLGFDDAMDAEAIENYYR
jgi:hypothetical protein